MTASTTKKAPAAKVSHAPHKADAAILWANRNHSFDTAEEYRAFLNEVAYDKVPCDTILPSLTAYRHLRQDARLSKIRTILFT